MTSSRPLHLLVAAAIVLIASTPASAALTRAAGPEENPRTPWIERYQGSRQGPEQTEKFSETYKVSGEGAFDLQNISGDVRVTTGRGGEIRVEATKRVRHRDVEEARRYMSQLRIETTNVGGRVEVRTIFPRSNVRSMSASVDYIVVVPQGAAVMLKTISGDVAVNGVRGEVRADTTSGDVEVISTPNLAFAKTISGDVRARDISAPGTINLGTISGDVIATALKVRTLEAGSVSGNVQLSDLQVDRLTAKTTSGNIQYDGTLARTGRYEFNAHSGNVRLVLPTNTPGFELDASSFSGSIQSDFGITISSSPNGRRPSRAMRGTFGDGGAYLSVRSFSGTVIIIKK